jgi:hypothetical protein
METARRAWSCALLVLSPVSVTFGGRDNGVLDIVGESSVWSIQTRVHGFRHPSGMN